MLFIIVLFSICHLRNHKNNFFILYLYIYIFKEFLNNNYYLIIIVNIIKVIIDTVTSSI